MIASYGVFVGMLLVLTGLAFRQPYALVPGVLALVALATGRLWRQNVLEQLSYRRLLSTERVVWGDTVELAIECENAKPLPVPWVECLDEWPAELPLSKGLSAHHLPGRMTFRNLMSLRWFERVTRRFTITCERRGRFLLGPVALVSGDPFGFDRTSRVLPGTDQLVVYPRVLRVVGPALSRRHPFGDRVFPSWVFEDPARTAGVREYGPRDPFNRIEWKATARSGRLQTRVFEASFREELALFLNLSTYENLWEGIDRELVERAITVSASLARWALEVHIPTGLFANGYHPAGQGHVGLRPGAGQQQLELLLEALATIPPVPWGDMGEIIDRARSRLGPGTAALVVTAVVSGGLLHAVDRLRRAGHPVVLVLVSGVSPPAGLVTYRAREEGVGREAAVVLDRVG